MTEKKFVQVDLENDKHCSQLLKLMDDYMNDEMGMGEPMPEKLGPKIIEGLKKHSAYIGFFVQIDGNYAALANCNLNFSTWKAMPLLNIHDIIVSADFRKQGVGQFLLDKIAAYASEKGFCRINLEVRQDNLKAQNLYKKVGFDECQPPNYFWEKKLE